MSKICQLLSAQLLIIISLTSSVSSLDLSKLSFALSVEIQYAYNTLEPKPQLSCSGNHPILLQTEQDELRDANDQSFANYHTLYDWRKVRREET